MKKREWYFELLACPDCGASFGADEERFVCIGCGFSADWRGPLDLRATGRRSVRLDLPQSFDVERELADVELSRPSLTYKGPLGMRDASELLSVLEQSLDGPGRVLDLGCGPRDQAEAVEYLGHHYVGVDLTSPESDVQADAHALPFADASFDFILSYAVLEHLHNPFLALSEVKRVLKPGGTYCGTVSQGEPFHDSFFHHTAWGVLSLARASDFQVERMWACWDTLSGLSSMGRYPRVIRGGLGFLDRLHKGLPLLAPRKLKWSAEARSVDELHRAASVGFVLRKNL